MLTTAVQIYTDQKAEIKCAGTPAKGENAAQFCDCLKSVESKLKPAGEVKVRKSSAENTGENGKDEKDIPEIMIEAAAAELGAAGISASKLGDLSVCSGGESDPKADAPADNKKTESMTEISDAKPRSGLNKVFGSETRSNAETGVNFPGPVTSSEAGAGQKARPENEISGTGEKAVGFAAAPQDAAGNKKTADTAEKAPEGNPVGKAAEVPEAAPNESLRYTRLEWTVNRLKEEQAKKGSESLNCPPAAKTANLSGEIQPQKQSATQNGISAQADKAPAPPAAWAGMSNMKTQSVEPPSAGGEIRMKVTVNTVNTADETNSEPVFNIPEPKNEAVLEKELLTKAAESGISPANAAAEMKDTEIKPARAVIKGGADEGVAGTDSEKPVTPNGQAKSEIKEVPQNNGSDKPVFKIREGAKSAGEKETSPVGKNETAANRNAGGAKETASQVVPFAEVYSGRENGITSAVSGEKLVSQITRAVRGMTKQDGGKFVMELAPRELGKITVEMKYSQGKLNVLINAASDETAKVLKAQLNELKTALMANKVEINSVDVGGRQSSDLSFSNMNGSGERYSGSERGGNNGSGDYYRGYVEERDDGTPETVYGWNRLLNYLV